MDNLGGLLSHILVSETHLGGEGAVRLPLGRGTGSGLLHHLVDLLEGETLGLRDEEVGVDKGTGAERSPDEEDLGLEVTLVSVDHVGGDDSDDLYEGSQQGIQFFFFFSHPCRGETYAVPEPVRGSGQSNTTGTDGQRVDLADDDPGTRTPGAGEEKDVNADEGDFRADGTLVAAVDSSDNGDNELADNHAQSTPEEKSTTTELFHGVEGDGSGADIDDGGDHADQERVADGSQALEEGGTEVEDEVDTSPPVAVVSIAGQSATKARGETYCCIICREVPRTVRRRLLLGFQRLPRKQLNQLPK